METAQIMMMPTASAAAAASAVPACAACPGAGGEMGFGSLLGQTLAVLQQSGVTFEMGGSTTPTQAGAGVVPAEMVPSGSDLTGLLESLGNDLRTDEEPQTAAQGVPEQGQAQQLAGLLQAAMLMPVVVQPSMPKVDDAGAAASPVVPSTPVVAVSGATMQLPDETLRELSALAPQEGGVELPVAHQAEAHVMQKAEAQLTQKAKAEVVDQPMRQPAQPLSSGQPVAEAVRTAEPSIRPEAASTAKVEYAAATQAVDSRAVAGEVSASPRGAAPTVAAVRFAQPSDVVAATVHPEQQRQQEQSLNSREQGKAASPVAQETVTSAEELPRFELKMTSATQTEATGNQLGVTVQRLPGGQLEVQAAEPVKATVEPQVMRQVTERLASHEIKPGADQISLKLSPEHLGNLQLNLRMEDQQVRVEIVAEHRAVRDALLQQVDQLKESLSKQNIKMESFDVTTSNNGGQTQQQNGDWRQTASDRRPLFAQQQYGAGKTASVVAAAGDVAMQYFAPQYQSTLDVRF